MYCRKRSRWGNNPAALAFAVFECLCYNRSMNTQHSLRAILYARVSTEDQTEGPSLDQQIYACKEYAHRQKFRVVASYKEDYTGTSLDRPLLTQALRLLERDEADVLVVFHMDRLSRNYIDYLVLRDQLEQRGKVIHYVASGASQPGFSGLLTDSIMALMAHGERERIVERMRKGKDGRVQRGEIIIATVPYGYLKDTKKRLIPDPERATIIQQIFSWYAYGTEDQGPLMMEQISKRLQMMGIESPSARGWSPPTIRYILRNTAYAGQFFYGKTRRGKHGKREVQDKSDWIRVDVPALVDEQTFLIVQQRLQQNQQLSARNKKNEYLLSGHLRCARCGANFIGFTTGGSKKQNTTNSYYYCPGNVAYSYYKKDNEACLQKRIKARDIEPAILEVLAAFLKDDTLMHRAVENFYTEQENALQPRIDRLKLIEQKISDLSQGINRLVRRLSSLDDVDLIAAVENNLREMSAKLKLLKDEQERVKADMIILEQIPDMERFISQNLNLLRHRARNLSFQDFRDMLRILGITVIADVDELAGEICFDVELGFPSTASIDIKPSKWLKDNQDLIYLLIPQALLPNKKASHS